jgi:hypothetical protein
MLSHEKFKMLQNTVFDKTLGPVGYRGCRLPAVCL